LCYLLITLVAMTTIHTDKSMVYILYLLVFWIKLKEGNWQLRYICMYDKVKML